MPYIGISGIAVPELVCNNCIQAEKLYLHCPNDHDQKVYMLPLN